MSNTPSKYARSRNRMVGGICAMIARETGADLNLIRVLTAIGAVITSGTILVIYLVAWALLPVEGETHTFADELIGKGREVYENQKAKHDATPSAQPGPAPMQQDAPTQPQQPTFDPYAEN